MSSYLLPDSTAPGYREHVLAGAAFRPLAELARDPAWRAEVQTAAEADRAWFRASPGRRYRLRPAEPCELPLHHAPWIMARCLDGRRILHWGVARVPAWLLDAPDAALERVAAGGEPVETGGRA